MTLDSDVCAVGTYHIEQYEKARDPELYLKKNLQKIEDKSDLDFLIIATGTNDITVLDVENEDISELTNIVCDQSRNLIHLANEAAQKHNLDVFVVERPPRGDENEIYSDLNVAANGLFPSLITPLKKVHYIPLPSLQKLPDKSRRNLFTKSGVPVHLKPWGLKLLRNDIVAGIKSVYKDLKQDDDEEEKEILTKDGKRKHQPEDKRKMFQQEGQKSFHDANPRRSPELDRNKTGGFQPAGRFGNHSTFYRNDDQKYVQHREGDRYQHQEQFQQDGPSFRRDGGNNQRETTSRQRGSRPEFGQESFQPSGRFDRGNPFNRDGDNRYGKKVQFRGHGGGGVRGHLQGYNHHEHSQSYHQQHRDSDRNYRGQQDGQMPDLVKQYLMKTLMGDGNQRY